MTQNKIERLKKMIGRFEKVAVAFSGGKDSFFLLKMSIETLGKNQVKAFFVNGPFNSRNDRKRVSYLSDKLDFKLKTLDMDFTAVRGILSNPRDRCYHCKKLVFNLILDQARQEGIEILFDGTSFSDLSEYRPGLKAIEELRIISPLRDVEITSRDVEEILTRFGGLDPYYLSSSTCLATRFPYDLKLTESMINQFDEIEAFLVDLGVFPVRVRYIPDGIRIETNEESFGKILSSKDALIGLCEKLGLKFITLDLGGLKSGPWD